MTAHQLALARICPENWPDVPLRCLLLHETSTVSPVQTDLHVSDLLPDDNELVNDDYARQDVGDLDYTWTGTRYELVAGAVTFTGMAAASDGQGVKSVVMYAEIDPDDDAANWIVKSQVLDDPELLTGGDLVIAWATDGSFTIQTAI